MRSNQKIAAIKRFREVHGVGLKEAKDAVDARADALARRR
nr:ribosomal protein L7/L12 [Nannocystis sp. ILAH1]